MPGVYRVNECVESGELAVVIVRIFVSYTRESGLQTNMNRNHSRGWSRRMMWSSWWVLLQLEVTLVYLSLHLCLFGDTSLPRMSYDSSVFWLMAFSFPVLPTLITFCPHTRVDPPQKQVTLFLVKSGSVRPVSHRKLWWHPGRIQVPGWAIGQMMDAVVCYPCTLPLPSSHSHMLTSSASTPTSLSQT